MTGPAINKYLTRSLQLSWFSTVNVPSAAVFAQILVNGVVSLHLLSVDRSSKWADAPATGLPLSSTTRPVNRTFHCPKTAVLRQLKMITNLGRRRTTNFHTSLAVIVVMAPFTFCFTYSKTIFPNRICLPIDTLTALIQPSYF